MEQRIAIVGIFAAALGIAQIPNAPNTQPKPVNDPTQTNNITGDPTVPGSVSNLPSSNPGIATNPGSGITEQGREAADQTFADTVTLLDLTAIEMDKLAATKSSNDMVKTYATAKITDNAKMIERLKRIASRGQVTIPAALDSKHRSRVDKLAKLSGDEFDRAFVHDQVQSVEHNLKAFELEIQNGSDPGLKALASRGTPLLQKHLDEAKSMEKSLKTK